MNYQININTKSKSNPYTFVTNNLDAFLETINKSQILWVDNMQKGLWLPTSEIVEISFEKLEDNTPSEDTHNPMHDALIHQQQTIEG